MKTIPLSQGKVAICDDEDYQWLSKWTWYYTYYGYAARASGKRTFYMHRELMQTPDGMETDHVNRDMLDNRKENLRVCTRAENRQNSKTRTDNLAGYKGVNKICNKWRARIRINNSQKHLGLYSTPEEAARAYDNAARSIFGKFAKLNFESKLV